MHHRRAFALVELSVVLVVLALLAGLLFPLVRSEMDKSLEQGTLANMRAVAEAYNRYYAHTGVWPADDFDDARASDASPQLFSPLVRMPCLFANVHEREGWDGPYLDGGARVRDGAMQVAAPSEDGGATAGRFSGVVDAWGHPFLIGRFAANPVAAARGGIVLVSFGANGARDTDDSEVVKGRSAGDDLVMLVARTP